MSLLATGEKKQMNARQIQKQVREAHVRALGFDSALKLHDDMYARWSAASDALNAFVNQFPKGADEPDAELRQGDAGIQGFEGSMR